MPKKDPNRDAFKAAANATRARIRDDRAQAPDTLSELFSVVERRIFDSTFNATLAWREAGLNDSDMGAAFKAVTETSLARYIADRRIEVAVVLRLTTGLKLAKIARKIGFSRYRTFFDTYRRLKKKRPSDERQQLPPPLIDDETGLLAVRGLLDRDAIVRFMQEMLRIYAPDADHIREAIGASVPAPAPKPLIIVNGARAGARSDRLEVEELWRKIRDLPFAEQCEEVEGYLFYSRVFFDLVREESLVAGRRNRRRGIELAELALLSLANSDEAFAERIHDLRALAWAWIGNAYRLALDFSAASRAFEQAEREWSTPRPIPDLSVKATICALKGSLRMMRREYVAATQDLDHSCSLFRQLARPRDEARELITRATIHGYAGKLGEAVDDLHEAARLIDEEKEKELAFAIRINLANARARAGHARRAAKELGQARQVERDIDLPLAAIELDCTAGLISELQDDLQAAKRFYLAGLTGYREAGEQRYFGMVSVDLMVVYAREDDWENVLSLAAEAVPILVLQELHEETLAAVKVLAKALKTRDITRRHLTDLRSALRQDPLAM